MATEGDMPPYPKRKKNIKKGTGYNYRWIFMITIWTFFLAIIMSSFSETLLKQVNLSIAFVILIIIVLIGILFDLIGIAVASSRETPFHSMASNKVSGAKYAIKLVRNAGPVANFCSDVVGDICGIVSGTAVGMIILKIKAFPLSNIPPLSIFLSGLVAAFTVGGKAAAKEIALRNATEIVYYVGKTLYYIEHKTGLRYFRDWKN